MRSAATGESPPSRSTAYTSAPTGASAATVSVRTDPIQVSPGPSTAGALSKNTWACVPLASDADNVDDTPFRYTTRLPRLVTLASSVSVAPREICGAGSENMSETWAIAARGHATAVMHASSMPPRPNVWRFTRWLPDAFDDLPGSELMACVPVVGARTHDKAKTDRWCRTTASWH